LEEITKESAVAEPLVITISHKLGKEEALRRVRPALGKASLNFPVLKVEEEVWSGDRLDFRVRALGQVAGGNVQVGEDNVRLEVTLPWLLHKFGEVVQRTIQGRGRILLEKK
jgi:Putative polyhydroxyalkanoic acid system protein (PHA_gran_rgn)